MRVCPSARSGASISKWGFSWQEGEFRGAWLAGGDGKETVPEGETRGGMGMGGGSLAGAAKLWL